VVWEGEDDLEEEFGGEGMLVLRAFFALVGAWSEVLEIVSRVLHCWDDRCVGGGWEA
jgi:hypothetical protein